MRATVSCHCTKAVFGCELQEFILNPLLSGIGARRYSKPEQLYELARACFQHLTLCVRSLRTAATPADTSAGSLVMSHLLSPTNPLLRELLTHVAAATPAMQPLALEALAKLAEDSIVGRAAEGAMAALFELLNAVLEEDTEWVHAQRRRQRAVEPLHALLMRPPAFAVQLVQFVQYSRNGGIQSGAVRLLGAVSTRDPNFTHTLLQFPTHARKLVYDCALCLGEHLFAGADSRDVGGAEEPSGDDESDQGANVAELLLQVLIDNAGMEFPNFAQLALGYSVQQVCAGNDARIANAHSVRQHPVPSLTCQNLIG